MATLKLVDDIDSVDFISATYRYIDNTFDAQIPSKSESRSAHSGIGTRDLLSMSYKNRVISFDFLVTGATDAAVHDNVTKITRMLIRASSPVYLSGGGYNLTMSRTSGEQTGDNGLVLRYGMKTASVNITKEDGTAGTDLGVLSFRIISGDLKINNQMAGVRVDSSGLYFSDCTITLEAEPFALGDARRVGSISGNGYFAYPASPDTATYNKMYVPAASIPGDAPALTRISTQLGSSQSVIIARDAGISVLNSTTYPIFSGAGLNDMFCYAVRPVHPAHKFRVKISTAAAQDSFVWSNDGGSTWESPAIAIVAKTPIQLGSYEIYVYFMNQTGHTLNNYWSFNDTQAVITATGGEIDLYAQREAAYSEAGTGIGAAWFTIPPGCTGKYMVYVDTTISDLEREYKMSFSYVGYSGTSIAGVSPNNYSWIRAFGTDMALGIVDFSPKVLPYAIHPGAFGAGIIYVNARVLSEISSGDTAQLLRIFLVPVQDDHAYLHVAWNYDGAGQEIYSNFDPNNPYIAEVANISAESTTIHGLDYAHAGSVITLIPGVDNTLYFLPMFNANADWRRAVFTTTAKTGATAVAIRPRYLFGG